MRRILGASHLERVRALRCPANVLQPKPLLQGQRCRNVTSVSQPRRAGLNLARLSPVGVRRPQLLETLQ